MIYLNIAIFTLILAVVVSLNKKNRHLESFFIKIITVILIVISGLRVNVGTDFNNYRMLFESTVGNGINNINEKYEFFYVLMNDIVSLFTDEYQVFLVILSSISLILIFKFINKYSKNKIYSFFLFVTMNFYTFSFNAQRQFLAMAIALQSLKYIINRDLKKFLIVIIGAGMIHKSAFIFLPIYFYGLLDIGLKKLVLILNLLVISLILNKSIIKFIDEIFLKYDKESWGMTGLGVGLIVLIPIIVGISAFIFKKKLIYQMNENNLLINILIISSILYMFAIYMTNFVRIAEYFYIVSIVVIPNIIHTIKDYRIKYNIYILISGLFLILFIRMTIIGNTNGVMPYNFYFS